MRICVCLRSVCVCVRVCVRGTEWRSVARCIYRQSSIGAIACTGDGPNAVHVRSWCVCMGGGGVSSFTLQSMMKISIGIAG